MKGISYNNYELSLKEKRDCVIISYLCLFTASYIFYHSLLISAVSGVFIPVCLKYYAEGLAVKKKELLVTQFRDFLYSLSASFAAGRHMHDGLIEARENLRAVYAEDTPMIKEISDMLSMIDGSRAHEEEVLSSFAARSSVRDIENFVETYNICRMTGGDIGRIISKTSGMLIEKIGIEKEIRALTSQKRFEGRIISAMPVIVILFLNVTSPGYIEALYTTFAGRVIMTAALAGIVYAYHLTMKITRIEV